MQFHEDARLTLRFLAYDCAMWATNLYGVRWNRPVIVSVDVQTEAAKEPSWTGPPFELSLSAACLTLPADRGRRLARAELYIALGFD